MPSNSMSSTWPAATSSLMSLSLPAHCQPFSGAERTDEKRPGKALNRAAVGGGAVGLLLRVVEAGIQPSPVPFRALHLGNICISGGRVPLARKPRADAAPQVTGPVGVGSCILQPGLPAFVAATNRGAPVVSSGSRRIAGKRKRAVLVAGIWVP